MSGKPSSNEGTVRAIVVPLVLFALAAVLYGEPWSFVSPVPLATVVPAWAVDETPVRHPELAPEIGFAGFTHRCNDCHKLFPSNPDAGASALRHTDIVLEHGINTRCFNCHNLLNRDTFTDDSGGEIPYDQPELLCARCHGPVYRDWQHGVHGRSNGYWDAQSGLMTRQKCTACHDPHVPPFPSMAPAPPPNTLRMGPHAPVEHLPGGNPLRVSQSSHSKRSTQDVAGDGPGETGLHAGEHNSEDDR